MPRKKNAAATSQAVNEKPPEQEVRIDANRPPAADHTTAPKWQGRSFREMLKLPAKGVTIGVRDGHDWVVTFPADPGKKITNKLMDAGFEYRDKKWKVFTHAGNRPQVDAAVREIKNLAGDDVDVHEYSVKQVVIAFPADPGPEITEQLKANDFHFRSDATWNAEFTPENQKFARDLAKSLPDQARSVAAGR